MTYATLRLGSAVFALMGLVAVLGTGCNGNIFDPFDSPTSDAQHLSAARACLDQQNYSCAYDNYKALSSSEADIANSEEAFATLDQYGAGMGAFVGAFASKGVSAGTSVTRISNSIGANAGPATRAALFNAYLKNTAITDAKLKGLVRFLAGTALLAEIFQEDAATVGDLQPTDLAPAGCRNDVSACDAAPGKKLVAGTDRTTDLSQYTAESTDTAHTSLFMVNAAISEVADALRSELGVTSNTALNFAGVLTDAANSGAIAAGPPDSQVYRNVLLENDIGVK